MPSPEPTTDTAIMLSPQLLAKARSDTARKWAAQALCAGADPELFFPSGDGPATDLARVDVQHRRVTSCGKDPSSAGHIRP